jgi:hypothetical protein
LEREPGESRWTRERFYEFAYGSKDTASASRNRTDTAERQSDRPSLPEVYYADYEKKFIHYEKSELYTYVQKELKGFRIGFAGGINMSRKDYDEVAMSLSFFGWEYDIDMQYNASHLVPNDLVECVIGLNYIATNPVRAIHAAWDRFFAEYPEGSYLQICHSQGAINVRNALLSYDEGRRNQISVLAIAPAAYMYAETCKEVHHFRAPIYRDIVPYFDVCGMIRSWDTITTVKCHKDAGLMDHTFLSPTYKDIIKDRITSFKKDNGI